MLFNSLDFFIFLPIALLLYQFASANYRWVILLAASYAFYAYYEPWYFFLLFGSTVLAYYLAIAIDSAKNTQQRKLYLTLSIVSNLATIFFFKYFSFFEKEAGFDIGFDIILPVGISFYTLQTLGYTIDVYRGNHPVEKHFGYFALYHSFFPQLVAGPIERSYTLLPQLRKNTPVTYENLVLGCNLMIWGFFKKLVIADRVGIFVTHFFENPEIYTGGDSWLSTLLFSFQIYCDFSGYTDIATGVALCFGISLMKNFDRPYFSTSIKEFWTRWHISLSSWFKDYVYFPLGGNRVVAWRYAYNILIVFAISGLWHGANWTFILWGLLHGSLMIIEHFISPPPTQNKGMNFLKGIVVFIAVSLLWIFFKANSIHDAITTFSQLTQGGPVTGFTKNFTKLDLLISFISIAFLLFCDIYLMRTKSKLFFENSSTFFRIIVLLICINLLYFFGVFSSEQFIYFQF